MGLICSSHADLCGVGRVLLSGKLMTRRLLDWLLGSLFFDFFLFLIATRYSAFCFRLTPLLFSPAALPMRTNPDELSYCPARVKS